MKKALEFWGISCILLFVLAQLIDWLQTVSVPMPLLVAAGLGLAAWSNYDKRQSFPFWPGSPPLTGSPNPESPPHNKPPSP